MELGGSLELGEQSVHVGLLYSLLCFSDALLSWALCFRKSARFYTDGSLEGFPTESVLLHGDIGTVQGHKPVLDERFLSGPTEDKSGPLLDDRRKFSVVV